MITEIGNILLCVSAALSLCLFSFIFLKKVINIDNCFHFSKNISLIILILLLSSFLLLSYAFLTDNFSLRYVATNSNLTLENIYKFSAVWGAHEGSILLWVLVLAFWCFSIALFSKHIPKKIIVDMLAIMGILILFFLLFILLTSNPFDRIFPIPLNGNDLNPLLQDPGLIIHPPMLYFGYVGTSVPFAFAVAILINENIKSEWLSWLRKWVMASWMFLTIGISLGSWWAYHELGWGGWWFWDPVENASFMPWLAITALLHSIIVSEKRGIFISWTILLSILTFSLSLLGTFLVRSGILVSVHAFANDPERGLYILVFLTIVIGLSLLLYFVKSSKLITYSNYNISSKEFILLINNLFLTVTTFAILLGTLYPLISSTLDLGKISVGAPYFNFIFSALTLPIVFLMSPAIFSAWKKTNYNHLIKKLGLFFMFSLIITYIFLHFYVDVENFIVFLAIVIAIFTILSSLYKLSQTRILSANLISHIGIGILIIGITISNYYSSQHEVIMKKGTNIAIQEFQIAFNDVKNKVSKNYTSKVGIFDLYDNKDYLISFFPEKRIYNVQKNIMTEAAIHSTLTRDIYVALGEKVNDNSWVVRIYYKPFIQFLWLGAILMILGGFFGIFGNLNLFKKN